MCLKNNVFMMIITATILTGCDIAGGEQFSDFQIPKQGHSKLYVYRYTSRIARGVKYKVAVNDGVGNKIIGRLQNGSFLDADIPANRKVEVWAKTETKSSVTIDSKEGEVYCIRGRVVIGFWVEYPKLEKVSLDTCRKEIINTRRP